MIKPQQPLVHTLDSANVTMARKTVIIAVLILLAGIGSGYLLSQADTDTEMPVADRTGGSEQMTDSKPVRVVGSSDTAAFPDQTEGTLQEGGIDGEGTHHLERPGGPSQTVYLTSSVLNLSEFIGQRVRVRGQTHAAKKAGWLMDVGKVEVL